MIKKSLRPADWGWRFHHRAGPHHPDRRPVWHAAPKRATAASGNKIGSILVHKIVTIAPHERNRGIPVSPRRTKRRLNPNGEIDAHQTLSNHCHPNDDGLRAACRPSRRFCAAQSARAKTYYYRKGSPRSPQRTEGRAGKSASGHCEHELEHEAETFHSDHRDRALRRRPRPL